MYVAESNADSFYNHSFLDSLNHTLPHVAEDPSVEYLPRAMPSPPGNLKLSPTLGFPTAHPDKCNFKIPE